MERTDSVGSSWEHRPGNNIPMILLHLDVAIEVLLRPSTSFHRLESIPVQPNYVQIHQSEVVSTPHRT